MTPLINRLFCFAFLSGSTALLHAGEPPQAPLPAPLQKADLSKFLHAEKIPAAEPVDIFEKLKPFELVWPGTGTGSVDSMPLGNGDIGLNVWTEPSGDLLFYIGKTDAWSEKLAASNGLMKLGRIRVNATPAPDLSHVTQTLRLHDGSIDVIEGAPGKQLTYHLWVDANHPVIRLDAKSDQPTTIKVSLEVWRTEQEKEVSADIINPASNNQVSWYHCNAKTADPVLNLTFGGLIEGAGFTTQSNLVLASQAPGTDQHVNIFALTSKPDSTPGDTWTASIRTLAKQDQALGRAECWTAHQKWWKDFWNRSYIFLTDDAQPDEALKVNTGYVLQRFTTACAGRGAYPIKFNGSIFVIDWPAEKVNKVPSPVNADFRAWGGQYWFQNTRPMYWPRLMAGDFDEMLPLFHMYQGQLAGNSALIKQYYHHDGCYFAETMPFWGGLHDLTNNHGSYTENYHTPILELSMMMLDYYAYTGDEAFLHQTLVPIATAGLTFFDQHFPHDPTSGKLVLDPDNAIEMFWKVHNPAPDIAGLHAVATRLLALPPGLLSTDQKALAKKILSEVPDLPQGPAAADTQVVLYPYEGTQSVKSHNFENPELYAIYPFQLYGIGRGADNLQLAVETYNHRRFKGTGCWVQDPIQAGLMGLTEDAKKYTSVDLTRKDPAQKFPAFWQRGHDYMPDEDNGGNGENGLQTMLLQIIDDKMVLIPAWPANWTAQFRLHAPKQTIIEGTVKAGKITQLTVTPTERTADVLIAPQ